MTTGTNRVATIAAYAAPALFLVTVAGFWPTYYAVAGSARTTIHLHNLLMMLWMFLLIVQPMLIVLGRRHAHRMIGRATLILAPLMVIAGLLVTREFLQQFGGQYPPVAFAIFAVSVVSITHFALTYALAIYFRHRIQLHARFMVATGLIAIGAALLRVFLHWVPWTQDFSSASNAGISVVGLVALVLAVNDYRLRIRLSPFLVTVAFFVIQHVCMLHAAESSWWQSFAAAFGG